MPEETKEEYIARHRRENGKAAVDTEIAAEPEKRPMTFKQVMSSAFFFILLALFVWVLFEIFGMMKSN